MLVKKKRIHPCHQDSICPHFARWPSTFRKIEDKRPDYKLENIDPEAVSILKAKAAGNEQPQGSKQEATADIPKYTDVNTFAKYLKSRDQRYLIAIGTDDLRWVLRAKDVRSGETQEGIRQVDLAQRSQPSPNGKA
jgi:hypothetical protein